MLKKLISILSNNTKDPAEFLKIATQKKKDGDLGGAVSSLKEAYKLISTGSTIYPVETFLRLPLYLQTAGKSDEAWCEFNLLLVNGYPNQMKGTSVTPMEHSLIYDKMRVFLKRESKYIQAVAIGIGAYLSWSIGLHLQNRMDELERYSSEESIKGTIQKLLKKTGKEQYQQILIVLVCDQLKLIPKINIAEAIKKVNGILCA